MIPAGKVCPKCDVYKDIDKFHVDRSRKDGHQYACKECLSTAQKKRRADKPNYLMEYHVRRKYGLSLDAYNKLMKEPCAICGGKSHHLDHDHVTDEVRQALCRNCNLMLGLVHDDPKTLRAAADYLEEHGSGGESCSYDPLDAPDMLVVKTMKGEQ